MGGALSSSTSNSFVVRGPSFENSIFHWPLARPLSRHSPFLLVLAVITSVADHLRLDQHVLDRLALLIDDLPLDTRAALLRDTALRLLAGE